MVLICGPPSPRRTLKRTATTITRDNDACAYTIIIYSIYSLSHRPAVPTVRRRVVGAHGLRHVGKQSADLDHGFRVGKLVQLGRQQRRALVLLVHVPHFLTLRRLGRLRRRRRRRRGTAGAPLCRAAEIFHLEPEKIENVFIDIRINHN